MTNEEFKAWLEGFSEAINETPTKEQWEKIKAKANQLSPSTKYTLNDYLYPQRQKNWWEETNIKLCDYGSNTIAVVK